MEEFLTMDILSTIHRNFMCHCHIMLSYQCKLINYFTHLSSVNTWLQCFDIVDWATGRASGQ